MNLFEELLSDGLPDRHSTNLKEVARLALQVSNEWDVVLAEGQVHRRLTRIVGDIYLATVSNTEL